LTCVIAGKISMNSVWIVGRLIFPASIVSPPAYVAYDRASCPSTTASDRRIGSPD